MLVVPVRPATPRDSAILSYPSMQWTIFCDTDSPPYSWWNALASLHRVSRASRALCTISASVWWPPLSASRHTWSSTVTLLCFCRRICRTSLASPDSSWVAAR